MSENADLCALLEARKDDLAIALRQRNALQDECAIVYARLAAARRALWLVAGERIDDLIIGDNATDTEFVREQLRLAKPEDAK